MFKKILLVVTLLILPIRTMAEYSATSHEVWAATFLHEKWIISNNYIDVIGIATFKEAILDAYKSARELSDDYNYNIYPILEKIVKSGVDWYRLWDTITRKEMAKIVTKLAWANPEEVCKWEFKDVEKDWGCKYIERMLKVGFIQSGEKFRPNDNITKSEAIKLMFKARGIKKIYNTSNWQEDYAKTASDLGLTELYTDYSTDAKRGWIFQVGAKSITDFFPIEKMKGYATYSDEAL